MPNPVPPSHAPRRSGFERQTCPGLDHAWSVPMGRLIRGSGWPVPILKESSRFVSGEANAARAGAGGMATISRTAWSTTKRTFLTAGSMGLWFAARLIPTCDECNSSRVSKRDRAPEQSRGKARVASGRQTTRNEFHSSRVDITRHDAAAYEGFDGPGECGAAPGPPWGRPIRSERRGRSRAPSSPTPAAGGAATSGNRRSTGPGVVAPSPRPVMRACGRDLAGSALAAEESR